MAADQPLPSAQSPTADKILAATRVDDATLNDGVIEINLPRLLGESL